MRNSARTIQDLYSSSRLVCSASDLLLVCWRGRAGWRDAPLLPEICLIRKLIDLNACGLPAPIHIEHLSAVQVHNLVGAVAERFNVPLLRWAADVSVLIDQGTVRGRASGDLQCQAAGYVHQGDDAVSQVRKRPALIRASIWRVLLHHFTGSLRRCGIVDDQTAGDTAEHVISVGKERSLGGGAPARGGETPLLPGRPLIRKLIELRAGCRRPRIHIKRLSTLHIGEFVG